MSQLLTFQNGFPALRFDETVFAPRSVLNDQTLSSACRVTYLTVLDFAQRLGSTLVAIRPARLARALGGLDPRTVRRHLAELEERGLVRRVQARRGRNAYALVPLIEVYADHPAAALSHHSCPPVSSARR